MTNEQRLLQVFLSPKESPTPICSEVFMKDTSLTCTCPGFMSRNKCKHTDLVQKRLDDNNGEYPIKVDLNSVENFKAIKDLTSFNEFIRTHADVEIL